MRRLALALLAATTLTLSGCGLWDTANREDAEVSVVASIAPLADIAQTVGGDLVQVTTLTPPGVEPHDLELSADQVIEIAKASLVVFIPGMQPAVDEAIAQQAADRAIDATADLDLITVDGTTDPHVWLSPANVAAIGESLAAAFSDLSPAHESVFSANAKALTDEMSAIAAEYRTALASCESTTLVTSHGAFAYLADEFGFTQVGITGLTPEAEPSPARLAEISDFVNANNVTTIYSEELMSPRVAEVIAAETGAQVAVLDPIESLDDGTSIADVMRSNLDVLVEGQRCR